MGGLFFRPGCGPPSQARIAPWEQFVVVVVIIGMQQQQAGRSLCQMQSAIAILSLHCST
jgi:hypothetical protein